MFIIRSLQTAALTAALATTAAAQATDAKSQSLDASPDTAARRHSFSIAAIQTRPQGTLGRNIGLGYGVSGVYLFRLDGSWSLRADVAAAAYGNETKRSALSEAVGDRVRIETRTTNYVVPVSVGPQLAWRAGALRPYVNAGVGALAFMTESAIEGGSDRVALASTTNQSDVALMWVAGGGIYVPIVRGTRRAELDVNVQYLHGGQARYLAPGSIVDREGGGVSISPLQSTTHLVMLRVGARFGL